MVLRLLSPFIFYTVGVHNRISVCKSCHGYYSVHNDFKYCYKFYRKDFFYPYDEYREVDLPDPVKGGRFHLVSTSTASGSPGQVILNGKLVTFESGQNPDDWFVDWLLVYPTTLVEGEPVWVSFHTR